MVAIIVFGAIATWFVPFTQVRTTDFKLYTGPWYEHILATGQIAAFAHPFGNYTPPYLYLLSATTLLDGTLPPQLLVKALSTLGALWLAVAFYRLLSSLRAPRPLEAAAWSLLLPSVVLNVPCLGQADCFWVAPCLLAIAAAIRRETLAMVLWAGVAVSFKAQAAFVGPFVMAVLLRQRAPLWQWVVPAAVYAGAMLPAWLVGWPARDLATIYIRQAQWAPPTIEGPFVGNAPNAWSLLKSLWVPPLGLGYILGLYTAVLFVWIFGRRRSLSPLQLLASACLCSAAVPFLLPQMHERFMMLADVSAAAYAFAARDRRSIAVAILMQLGSICAIYGFLDFSNPWLPPAGGLFVAAAMLLLVDPLRHTLDEHIGEMVVLTRNAGVDPEAIRCD